MARLRAKAATKTARFGALGVAIDFTERRVRSSVEPVAAAADFDQGDASTKRGAGDSDHNQ